jgi:hypothetical protein
MQNNPTQTVRRLTIEVETSRYRHAQIDFGMKVWVKGERRIWRAGGQCEAVEGEWRCRPDTDGAPRVIFRVSERGLRALNPGHLQIFDDKTGPDLNTRNLYPPGDGAFLLTSRPSPYAARVRDGSDTAAVRIEEKSGMSGFIAFSRPAAASRSP